MLHYFTDSLDFLAVPRTVVIMYNIGFDISRAYYNLNRCVLTYLRYLDHHAFIITIIMTKERFSFKNSLRTTLAMSGY